MAFSDEEKADALGDILGEMLDEADLYDVDDRVAWSELVDIVEFYAGIAVHRWDETSQGPVLVVAAPVERWIVEALRYALIGRGSEGDDIGVRISWVS